MAEMVILVDENDNKVGTEEKLKAHQQGILHRAFSIFIFNSKGQLLLQQRAKHKYHSSELWTNTCCSHPRPEEPIQDATHRRLQEEMGFSCDMQEILQFTYKASVGNSLTEHEFDHVFVGKYDGKVLPNPEEVQNYMWVTKEELVNDIENNPNKYTEWLKIVFTDNIDKIWLN